MLRSLPLLSLSGFSIACGGTHSAQSPAEARARPEPHADEPRTNPPVKQGESEDEFQNAEVAAPPGPESAPPTISEQADTGWLVDGRAPDPKRGLPEISMRHIGMHIGGESNSDEAKRPWLKAIEREETRILFCYRAVKDPMAGGTVGVDLYIGKSGGQPDVRKTRQRLGEADFDDCVRKAFGAVRFPAPKRPTVVSYSLRFDVRDPTTAR